MTHTHARPVVKALRTAIIAAAAACAALLYGAVSARAASGGDVAVICDQEIAPYAALLEGLRGACDCTVRVIPPREAVREGLQQRLRAAGVRAVVAVGLQARAAVEAVRGLPIVLTMVPQVGPWVAAQPNRFGIEMSLSPRRHLETLRRVFPWAKRVGLVFDPRHTGGYVLEARGEAAALGLALETREIAQPGEFSRRLDELRGVVDVLWLLPDPTVLQGENLNVLLLASFESRRPIYGFARKYAERGAVAATNLDPAAIGAQAAAQIRSLSNPPAAAGPARWEYAGSGQLVLNQKVARKMGLTLDPAALAAADDVLR